MITQIIDGKRVRSIYQQIDIKGNIICYICKDYKNIDEFDVNNENTNRYCRDRRCKECKSKQHLKRKLNNRGKQDLDRILLERWHGVKDRANKKNKNIDFDWKYLKELWEKQEGLCNISKIPMTYIMNNGRVSTNLSVDKINSNLPYSKNNIQLVCMAVNQMKSDLTIEELKFFCENILKNS